MPEVKLDRRSCMEMISGVCRRCGGPLSAIETVDNANDPTFWAGCYDCSTFDWGTDPKSQSIAAELVRRGEKVFAHMDRPGTPGHQSEHYADYYRKVQTAGMTSIVAQVLHLAREVDECLK